MYSRCQRFNSQSTVSIYLHQQKATDPRPDAHDARVNWCVYLVVEVAAAYVDVSVDGHQGDVEQGPDTCTAADDLDAITDPPAVKKPFLPQCHTCNHV